MDQACEDILGKQVKIPVEVNVYGALEGYPDPRAEKIDTMLKTVLNGAEQRPRSACKRCSVGPD
jgi:hypothetical protein